jgi:hypothetical protein
MADDGRITCGTFQVGTFAVGTFQADQVGGFPPRRGRQRGFEWDRDWRRAAAERGAIDQSGEPSFLPADLAGRVYGYSAANPETLTIVSDAISQIDDNGAGSISLTQGTAASRPTLANAPNGNVGILSDGVDDVMVASSVAIGATDCTMMMVCTPLNVTQTAVSPVNMRLSFENQARLVQNTTGLTCFRNDAGAGTDCNLVIGGFFAVGSTNYVIFRSRLAAAGVSRARSSAGLTNTAVAPDTFGAVDNLTFFAQPNASNPWGGFLHEAHYWSRFLTDDETDQLEAYIQGAWTIGA